ncbi:MAG: hypothetical protein US83_C0014G0001 [Candidatus Falkowbacteria bacterium GW2011_GWC2_38_22]|uniref:Uncharacterized protein n=1 Tax=Candidatus Falkowbacteria bacterium GW2011_GWE1_38_31 TaxID=1618638 RepID=A0A0G0MXH9_9BACT|nr:MAG: hypothetical protein US73_C0011G0001 [Candidatus Falkowbacteria bacterium GW2011_GWF2_38_1205]KKQ60659.1 MAG: hypothetical protein US83_C0014G0001 [Candidatus Falkowbacteria bacterium GW2011_GWC2_38_22]KKQ62799.1 MAG: hypothetical protein US84_C0011G0001 [Candidatus Falkowbacteria bacterium GW2011_GWF1_38_22]KKQ64911.1 MAG: hypothetical protein US87_C0011G0001 [Candidatus Falkowbacteria bacterium GW2011_GWE2_38_254]KKQ69631.1 MAG: hypothetical protein US91_C0011G0001 [Candidatus Falkowb
MKKIISSLISIIIVAVFTVGSTIAFFSDTETSADNVFSAGSLDIKIDSQSHFRDLVCTDGYWIDPYAIVCEDTTIGKKDNEYGKSLQSFFVNTANAMVIDEKKNCEDYGFDYTIAKWEYKCGSYLPEGDPNGTSVSGNRKLASWTSEIEAAGIIRKAAWDYMLLSGGYMGYANWYCPMGENNYCHDISHIEICGNNEDTCGDCVLDNGEECDNSLNVAEGFYCTNDCKLKPLNPCTGTWEESDLLNGAHKFFEYARLVPGDYGEDTISFHVYDNDAWGRLVISKVKDDENYCMDGEYFDEPICSEDGFGELGEKIHFTAWLDDGDVPGFQNGGLSKDDEGYDAGEGDNIQQGGEIEIRARDVINAEGEIWDLIGVLTARNENECAEYSPDGQNNGGICHGLAEDGRLVGGTTYYIGLAWEFPAEQNNSTQSDTLVFDMGFEIEQWRNNNEPF